MSDRSEPITSLYVHVPFCAHKCEYCAFYSEASNGEMINRYVHALIREMELVAHDLKPRTVFFGGGTPSILTLRQWEEILKTMERLNLLGAEEWTVECNPATVSADKARLLRSFGVNRISMGVQSLDENLLDRLGRIHSREMVFKSFDILRAAGFDNINLDFMFAIPGQTMDIWRNTLREAMAFGSEHLSCYEVIYEDDTPLYAQLKAGKFSVDEELACAMYDELLTTVEQGGYHQYEIANFAKNASAAINDFPDRACKHNVNYWRGGSFYALGPSAAGYVRGVRTKNWSNTQMYCEQLERGLRAIESKEELAPLARAGEIAAFGLRMNSGWPLAEFKHRTGFDLQDHWQPEIRQMLNLGYAQLSQENFHLTRQGLRYADWAAELFLKI
ncbi:MAG: Oxygen-independent coproporphyrinogen-III oxidase-like protein [Verrucomicrobiales bacterium]|nr:Oxygen-independent coproporphyrinogen-III oxidase-like protein [Verrucomicrobiales bacterium]